MNSNDFASADAMVLGVVAASMGAAPEMAGYVMASIEKYGVQGDWFRDLRHKQFFEAAVAAWREHRALDVFHVKKRYEDADGLGFVEMFEELAESGAMSMHLEHYLNALKQKSIYGKVHKMTAEWLAEMKPDNIGIQLEDFAKKLHDFQETLADNDNGLRRLGDYVEQSVARKKKLHEERFVNHNWEFMDGLPWPWHSLNQIFTGLKPGLHVVAALASQGKSTMAADLSVFWNERGIKHGIVCIDMAGEQYADRYPSIMERVSLAKLNFGGSEEDVAKFERGFRRAAEMDNVWITEEDGAKTIEYLCYRGVKTLGWKAVIIDYIQLVSPDEKGQMPEYTRVQRAVQAVKRIAKRLKIPIICLAQLSRQFEKEVREGKYAEPGLDAIGDSAEIARAAASVTAIYYDEDMRKYWKETPPTQLAFGDKTNQAIVCGIVGMDAETQEQATARQNGQASLAKSLRPMWVEVLKNQQGGRGKLPFVMYPGYFLFRPGDVEGEDEEVLLGGKSKKLPVGKFEHICDDWTYAAEDWWLEMTGAMPRRGCKLMGETYAQMRERMAEERKRHPEVKQFVREYDDRGRVVGWHWQEPAELSSAIRTGGAR